MIFYALVLQVVIRDIFTVSSFLFFTFQSFLVLVPEFFRNAL